MRFLYSFGFPIQNKLSFTDQTMKKTHTIAITLDINSHINHSLHICQFKYIIPHDIVNIYHLYFLFYHILLYYRFYMCFFHEKRPLSITIYDSQRPLITHLFLTSYHPGIQHRYCGCSYDIHYPHPEGSPCTL